MEVIIRWLEMKSDLQVTLQLLFAHWVVEPSYEHQPSLVVVVNGCPKLELSTTMSINLQEGIEKAPVDSTLFMCITGHH